MTEEVMTEDKQQFFSHGKLFDNEEKCWKFSKEWPDMPLDMEEFKNQMKYRIEEIEINRKFSGGTLTNRDAYKILRLSTDWAVREKK